MDPKETQKALHAAILQGERSQANALLEDYALSHSYRLAMSEVMEPVLEEIGLNWDKELISLAQGYIAGKVAEDCLLKVDAEDHQNSTPRVNKGPVVIGNIEDDFHSLGRKLITIFLQSAGWQVIDIGNDVPAEDFVNKAVETGARIIGVSAMMYTTAENIKKVRSEIDRRNLSGRIKLAVGGAVFKLRPELSKEVGGDGTASNGFLAPELFGRLWEQSESEVPL
jgi:methanogenic corrinoid protein MtbC1